MTATEIQLPAMPVTLRLDPPTKGSWAAVSCLRTTGGHLVAYVPVSVRLNPAQADRLFQAWLARKSGLAWTETVRILAEEGASA